MPTYLTPGIYVEEISTGPRPIEAVGTSTAGFVGVAPDANARAHEAVAINNWSQFVKEFAPEGSASTFLAQAVFGFFQSGTLENNDEHNNSLDRTRTSIAFNLWC